MTDDQADSKFAAMHTWLDEQDCEEAETIICLLDVLADDGHVLAALLDPSSSVAMPSNYTIEEVEKQVAKNIAEMMSEAPRDLPAHFLENRRIEARQRALIHFRKAEKIAAEWREHCREQGLDPDTAKPI